MSASVVFEKPCEYTENNIFVRFFRYEDKISASVCSQGPVVVNRIPLTSFNVTLELTETDWKLYNFSYPLVEYSYAEKYKTCSQSAYKKILLLAKYEIGVTWALHGPQIIKDLASANITLEHKTLKNDVTQAQKALKEASANLAAFEAKNLA
jgi:hypothetical protein